MSELSYLVGIVLVLALLWVLQPEQRRARLRDEARTWVARARDRLTAAWRTLNAPPAAQPAAPTPLLALDAPPPTADEPLGARLHRLEGI